MQAQNNMGANDSLLVALMKQSPNHFASLLADPSQYRIQILYTQINRDKNNTPHFKEYSYRLNANEYFYPASTVKFPLSVLALEKLNIQKEDRSKELVKYILDLDRIRKTNYPETFKEWYTILNKK
mgnify:CR=1 FL=1